MVSAAESQVTNVRLVEGIEPNVAELMEKNMMDDAERSEEPSNIADLVAAAGEDVISPDDFVEQLDEATGRTIRRFKETPADFLDDAEQNIQNIASLMMQTLDMMIEM